MATPFLRYLERRERRRPDALVREHRRRLLAGLDGRVLEVGCGSGRNFEHYPASARSVLAIEPDEEARAAALERAAGVPAPIEVVAGTADSLPAADASFDAVVVCWVLCTVPEPAAALAEIRRVLKPGGELRVYEHVRSPDRLFFAFQRLAESLGVGRLYDCRVTRDTAAELRATGFDTGGLERVFHSSSWLTRPTAPHVLGTARLQTS